MISKKSKIEKSNKQNIKHIKKGDILSIYSHKGGVGKTTICANFCHQLIKNYNGINKILIIDMDQQMNLSYFLTGHYMYKFKTNSNNNNIDNNNKISPNNNNSKSTNDIVMNEFEIRIDKLDKMNYNNLTQYENKQVPEEYKQPDILTKLRLFEQKFQNNKQNKDIIDRVYKTEVVLNDNNNNKNTGCEIDLLFGNHRLTEFVSDLTHELSSKRTGIYHNALKTMLECYRRKYDLIVIDLPPDLYTLNKITLLLSNKIICVLNPDIFAKITLKLIKKYFFEDPDIKRLIKENYSNQPHLIGYILNKVKIKTNRIAKRQQKIKEDIDKMCLKNFKSECLGYIGNLTVEYSDEIQKQFLYMNESVLKANESNKTKITSQMDDIITKCFNVQEK